MAAAGIWNHMAAGQALTGASATPRANAATGSGSSDTSTSSSSSSTISSNDFLTLLVTEMQNQDPTADTDPNEYINQLVNVNSLEQLISINQTLTTDLGSSTADASGSTASAQAGGASAEAKSSSSGAATTLPGALSTAAAQLAPGNLGIPAPNAAAQSVAEALSGRPRVQ